MAVTSQSCPRNLEREKRNEKKEINYLALCSFENMKKPVGRRLSDFEMINRPINKMVDR